MGDPISLLISLVVVFLIIAVLWYIVSILPLPEPFPLIARIVFAIIALLILLDFLGGYSGFAWHRH